MFEKIKDFIFPREKRTVINVRKQYPYLGVATKDDIIGKKVLGFSLWCGTYGMGGPGFLGFF